MHGVLICNYHVAPHVQYVLFLVQCNESELMDCNLQCSKHAPRASINLRILTCACFCHVNNYLTITNIPYAYYPFQLNIEWFSVCDIIERYMSLYYTIEEYCPSDSEGEVQGPWHLICLLVFLSLSYFMNVMFLTEE